MPVPADAPVEPPPPASRFSFIETGRLAATSLSKGILDALLGPGISNHRDHRRCAGFGGLAAAAGGIANILFFVFLVLFVIALIGGLMRRRRTTL